MPSGRQGQDAEGATGTARDLEGSGDEDGTGGRKLIEVAQGSQPEAAAAVHGEVVAEGRIELRRLAGIRADGLDSDPDDVPLVGEELRASQRPAGRMGAVRVGVDEGVAAAGRPACPQEDPGAGRNPAVLLLPALDG